MKLDLGWFIVESVFPASH